MSVTAIVLAAGGGTRMRSDRPKPLHRLCGRPMVLHVITALADVELESTVVVVGHGARRVEKQLSEHAPDWARVSFAEQIEQRGTGHATMIGLDALEDRSDGAAPADDVLHDDAHTVLVLPGDTPLLTPATIAALVAEHDRHGWAATVLTARLENPTGYGRVVRTRDATVARIVEHRDASDDERAITEINTGIFAFRRNLLGPALRRISPDNAQAEYYLTDVVEVLASMGHRVGAFEATPAETVGVNDRAQLAAAEAELRRRIHHDWMLAGVTMVDPDHTYVDVTARLGRDVTLHPGTVIAGSTTIGDGCEIGPHAHLVDCVVGEDATVAHTVARSARIGSGARVGPFVSLGPGDVVTSEAEVGPFYTGEGSTPADTVDDRRHPQRDEEL
jgi:bifunctional UDP-N-acetylglucosamine pyrophosphorylase/glucosamine-1-phosphate N-acetyltransferase